ncbi:MAG: hypothetical protein QXV73_04000 [Candidatus Micrarchaeia archaeon]
MDTKLKMIKNYIVSELEWLKKRQEELAQEKDIILNKLNEYNGIRDIEDLKRKYDDLIWTIFKIDGEIKLLKKVLDMIEK